MMTMVLLLAVVLALGAGALAIYSLLPGPDNREPDIGTETWSTTNAEVVSVLRAGARTFLQVRYSVGTSVVHVDVLYPLGGDVPLPGRRIPVRYDPAAPARAVYDRHRTGGTPAPRPLTRA